MKKCNQKTALIAILTFMIAVTVSCKKETSTPTPTKSDIQILNEFTTKYGPKFEEFTINGSTGAQIKTSKGTRIVIKPNVLVRQDGSLPTGPITVFFKDILDPKDMILDNKPTRTQGGDILQSFGEFIMKAKEGNNVLKIKNDSVANPVVVNAPINRPAQGFVDIPLWKGGNGDSAVETQTNGLNHDAVSVTVTNSFFVNKGLTWQQLAGQFANASSGDTVRFPLDSLGQWRNCDVLYSIPGTKTTVLCYFNSNFNNTSGTNYTGLEPSSVFFKPQGVNSLIKPYNKILNPIAGKEGFYSYQNSIPIGLNTRFLAMSVINGKYYAQVKDVTIANSPSKSYMGLDFQPVEVTEAQLLIMIDSVKNY